MHPHFSCYTSHPVKPEQTGLAFKAAGTVAELFLNREQSLVVDLMLLPLLQHLSEEPRWQLWLTPQNKLSRCWLKTAGLPLNKLMQIRQKNNLSLLNYDE